MICNNPITFYTDVTRMDPKFYGEIVVALSTSGFSPLQHDHSLSNNDSKYCVLMFIYLNKYFFSHSTKNDWNEEFSIMCFSFQRKSFYITFKEQLHTFDCNNSALNSMSQAKAWNIVKTNL